MPLPIRSAVHLTVLASGLLFNACASAPRSLPVEPAVAAPATLAPTNVVVPDCALQEVAYFRCMLDGAAPGAIAVCGRSSPSGVPTDVQVRLSAPDGTALVVPAQMDAARSALQMNVVTRPQFSSQLLSFRSEGRTWTVFSEHDVEYGPQPRSRGVRVTNSSVSGPDAWQCVDGAIDRLGELEPLLASEVAHHG